MKRALCLFLFFASVSALLSIGGASPACSVEEPQTIASVAVEGLTAMRSDDLLSLLDIAQGKAFDAAKLRSGIKRAFMKGLFDDIRIERVQDRPLSLKVVVLERKKIGSIHFAGNQSFSDSVLTKWLGMRRGDLFRTARAEAGVASIMRELRRRGYRDVQAGYAAREESGRIALSVTISEGMPELISKIVIEDPENYLPAHLGLSEGGVYDAAVLEQALAKTRARLGKQGIVQSRIASSFENGVLVIVVLPGHKLSLSFSGNRGLGNSELREETGFFIVNGFDDNLIEESISRMRVRYREAGYSGAQIVPLIEQLPDRIKLTYFIAEGERQVVKSIRFSGNTLSEKKLREQISYIEKEPFDPDMLEQNRESLERYYRNAGYLSVVVRTQVVSQEEGGVDLLFNLEEGPVTYIKSVKLTGVDPLRHQDVLKAVALKPGDAYSDAALAFAKIQMAAWYQRQGYSTIEVSATRELAENSASVAFVVREGKLNRFGKSVIVGNEKTKEIVLRREFLHAEGAPFDPKILLNERVALSRTGLFSSVDIETDVLEGDVRDVIYRVQESPAGAVEFGLGYAEYERFRGFFDVGYRNVGGMSSQAAFRIDVNSLLKRATLSYYQPWVFGKRDLALKAILLGEIKRELNAADHSTLYRSDRYGFSAGFEKRFSNALKAGAGYELSNVHTYDVKPGIVLSKEDTGTLIISSLHASMTYDRRDNAVDPKNGYLLGATLKSATPWLFSETSFNKLSLFANFYVGLSERIIAALSLRGGAAGGFHGTNDLPIVERFFLGGRTTVRGYQQDMLGPKDSDGNPVGGNAFFMGNFEFRTSVWKELGLVTFLDWGNIWSRANNFSLIDLKYTTGLGLRYNTPVGPVRIDYGIKLNREEGESRGALHFSIGHAF
ncbi:MAG TPA: outer membrane protein assembly factor BamA [Dissulfurispiraceae bacterium]|nr:outer membrane protein assembly factor BamA [Dissulfurispiraceae bacterium]